MASLEHRSDKGRDCYRLRFTLDGKRHRLSLAELDERQAGDAKEHIEHLIAQSKRDKPPSETTAIWLDSLPSKLHDRLAVLELVEPRRRVESPRTIIAFMRAYISERTDWKKPQNYTQAVGHLKKWLKTDVPINALTKGDIERWKRWMTTDTQGPKLAENTAGQNIKRCRQMMRQALDDGLANVNPFAGIKIDLSSDRTKNRYLSTSDTNAILEACPDQEWRVIVALCRIAGLRGPSEITPLKWSDISWERGRFTVTSPKTKRYGKATRVVPLFEELRKELTDLLEIKGHSSPFVITRYRDSTTSLSTRFNAICVRAGVAEMPKPFPKPSSFGPT
ncbi:MAG: site-specific integrase [Planctomycetota bacterium]